MKIGFYYVDEQYITHLKSAEIEHRGFTTVPNTIYANRQKFFYGMVMEVNNIPYYVPISHKTTAKEHSIVITIDNHNRREKTGSMRFNYMIPVPRQCIKMLDLKDTKQFTENERIRIERELKFCKSKLSTIRKLAEKTYQQVLRGSNAELSKNSCDFSTLEEAYRLYLSKTL